MNIRLSETQIKTIKQVVKDIAGSEAKTYLFGSRTDLNSKGGDIDILILLPPKLSDEYIFQLKLELLKGFYKTLGERKIDLLIVSGKPKTEIEKIAIEKGVIL
ncbi:MAG: nucleotidyltransferase domain-containing protein [Brevinematales bacterium]|nr:nucleotidyltransferase domain-containing protein [Brevinematales bacterium]